MVFGYYIWWFLNFSTFSDQIKVLPSLFLDF